MTASPFPHLGTDFTTKILLSGFVFDHMLMEPSSTGLIWLFRKEDGATFAHGQALITALTFCKGFVQAHPSLPSPWHKEIRSCSQGNVVCFEDYKAMEIIVRRSWCCRGDWRLDGDVQPRGPGGAVSHVGYCFPFLEEGLQDKVSGPIHHCGTCLSCLLLQSQMHWPESQIRLSALVVWSGDLGLWASNFSFCNCFKKTSVWNNLRFPKDVP